MKRNFLFLLICVSTISLFAQAPEQISYQAVVRDANGDLVADQQVSFYLSIISGSVTGNVEYAEEHTLTTNSFGLVTIPVGSGTVGTGNFSNINWGNNTHFMKVEVDIAGGSNYTDMGTIQLLSVPYALYAKNAGNQFSGNYNDLTNAPVEVSSFVNDAGYITSPNDADSDPANELQTLSIAGDQLSISSGNAVTIPTGINYTAGTGIDIQGSQIINTDPDQTVSINSGTGIAVTGTYPDFTVVNTMPDQSVTITGTGATTVTGTYPNYTISSTDQNTVYTAGTGIDITGTTITNTAPNQVVALTGSGATSVSGTYPNFTITSTDNNTTYTAGFGLSLTGTMFSASYNDAIWNSDRLQSVAVSTGAPASGQVLKYNGTNWAPAADNNTTYTAGSGLALSGTAFSHSAHTGDITGATSITVTGIQGRQVTANAPANGQVLKWNTTNNRWELGDDELGAAGTNDGVVTSIGVSGTTTKTITLTRSQSLPNLTATFNDEGSVYTAGTGMTLTGNTFNAQTTSALWNANQLRSVNVSATAPASGQVLKYDGANWAPAADNNTTYTASTGITLVGTDIRHLAHTGDVSGTTSLIVTGIQGRAVTTAVPVVGQVLKFDGTNWAPAADNAGAGTVTSIATNNGITGGTITTTGTIGLTGQALALHNLATNGLIARTAAGTVAARTITGSSGLTVTNGDGVSGNPVITPVYGTVAGTIAEGSHTHGSYGVAGTNGMVQFNNSGLFGGVQTLIWDNTNSRLMINGLTTTGQQSNLIVRQLLNPVNATRDSVILANMGLDIRQNSTTNYQGAGMKFTIGNADTYTGTAAIFAERTGGWSSGDLHFAVNDVGVSGKTTLPIRMTIKNTGRVGIGTRTPTAQLEVRSNYNSPSAEALFEVKNKAGQTVFVVYEDSVRIFIDDDGSKSNKGTFAVSGRNTAKAFTNNFLWVTPDSSRVYTGDPAKGFGVRSISGSSINSYMNLTPDNYFIGHNSGINITPNTPFAGDGTQNSTLGYETGMSLTYGQQNVFIGYRAGKHQNGYSNVIIGSEAGLNTNTTGTVMIGKSAGHNTNGDDNIYIGLEVGRTLNQRDNFTTVMIGSEAGYKSYGGQNIFIGAAAGYNSYSYDVERYENIFIGQSAGSLNYLYGGLSDNNICVGNYSGNRFNGSNNVCIGSNSGYNYTGNNMLFIEHSTNTTNPLIHGDFANDRIAFHRIASTYPFRVGTTTSNGNGAYLTAGGTWTSTSSKTLKDRFVTLNGKEVLSKIEGMELKGWFFKETQEYHIGPFAEDFYEAFGCGVLDVEEDLGHFIAPGDVAGVSMVAIQELIKEMNRLKNDNEELKSIVKEQQERISKLEKAE